ncbi:hypothetical protein MKEN_00027900 [Mycena kentingensis (nom. inval.)]|nr:hypothetical protein MKEN_00027900 [Mycena kentingensis (nom. inval.)]
MPTNKVAENVFGTLGAALPIRLRLLWGILKHTRRAFLTGTVCWTIQLIPQVLKSYREKSTKGLSPWLVLSWAISGGFFGVYAIVQNLNIPLIVQPQLFGLLCMVSWGQCQYYDAPPTRSKRLSLALSIGATLLLGAFEAAMVFALRPSMNARAIQFFGIFASVMLALGLLPQYHEIYKRREVIGISVLFMLVDLMGGVFSDLSLTFKPEFDGIAAVSYTLVAVMDAVVILCALILNPRAARRRRRELDDHQIDASAQHNSDLDAGTDT